MQRGDASAVRGDWTTAMRHYQAAIDLDPNDQEAQQKYQHARRESARGALEQAHRALEARHWSRAVTMLDDAQRLNPDLSGTDALRQEIVQDMLSHANADFDAGQLAQGHAIMVEAHHLFPRVPKVLPLLKRFRQTIVAAARDEANAGRFSAALARIDTLIQAEPMLETTLAPQRREINNAWALTLRKDATDAGQAGHLGHAYVRYVQCVELIQAPEDVIARDRLRETLRQRGLLTMRLTTEGPHARTSLLRDHVLRTTRTLPGLTSTEGNAALTIHVALGPVLFHDSAYINVAEHRYIAGTEQIENPERVIRQRALADTLRALANAERDVLHDLEALKRAEDTLDNAWNDPRIDQLRRRIAKAESELVAAEQEIEHAERDFDRALDALERLQQKKNPPPNALQSARKDKRRAQEACQQARRKANEARDQRRRRVKKMREQRDGLKRLRDDVTNARQHLMARQQTVLDRRQAVIDAQERVYDVPATISKDIWDTFRYDIHHHSRHAETTATLTLNAERFTLTAERITQDTRHPAHTRFGINENPLRFPQRDADLIQYVDRDAASHTIDRIKAYMAHHRDAQLAHAKGLMATNYEEATTLLVVHVLSSSGHIDDNVQQFFRDRFNLTSANVLR